MMETRAPLFERLAGSPSGRKLLSRVGLDAGQFPLFLQLLRTLSGRQEFMGNLGVDRVALASMAMIHCLFVGTPIAFVALTRLPAPSFLLLSLSSTSTMILLIVVAEAANTLYNPVEALALAHHPVHGPTYVAAKLAHVAIIVVIYLVPALALPSACAGLGSQAHAGPGRSRTWRRLFSPGFSWHFWSAACTASLAGRPWDMAGVLYFSSYPDGTRIEGPDLNADFQNHPRSSVLIRGRSAAGLKLSSWPPWRRAFPLRF